MKILVALLFFSVSNLFGMGFYNDYEGHGDVLSTRNTVEKLLARSDRESDLKQAKKIAKSSLKDIRNYPARMLSIPQLADDFNLLKFLSLRTKHELAQFRLIKVNRLEEIAPREEAVDHYRKKLLQKFSDKKLQKQLNIEDYMQHLKLLQRECDHQIPLLLSSKGEFYERILL